MGLSGRYIIMQSDNFIQGMAHETALDFNIATLNSIEKNIKKHYDSLPLRPDYDGFITISEGVKWAKTHIGAKNNPNPENTLYIDASKMDFGDIGVGEFSAEGDVSSLNLVNWNNIAGSWFNHRLRSSVYALGRFKAQLINSKTKTIVIINDDSTVYDWNKGGDLLRNLLITIERGRAHLGDDHGFNVYYYGTGYLR